MVEISVPGHYDAGEVQYRIRARQDKPCQTVARVQIAESC